MLVTGVMAAGGLVTAPDVPMLLVTALIFTGVSASLCAMTNRFSAFSANFFCRACCASLFSAYVLNQTVLFSSATNVDDK